VTESQGHQNYRGELPKLTKKTLGKRKKRDGEEEEGMWNKKSILWELEYWPVLDVRHSIENMHVKKNVATTHPGKYCTTG
jgi:hypothetical protein